MQRIVQIRLHVGKYENTLDQLQFKIAFSYLFIFYLLQTSSHNHFTYVVPANFTGYISMGHVFFSRMVEKNGLCSVFARNDALHSINRLNRTKKMQLTDK